jgi:hypothetical protein
VGHIGAGNSAVFEVLDIESEGRYAMKVTPHSNVGNNHLGPHTIRTCVARDPPPRETQYSGLRLRGSPVQIYDLSSDHSR